MAEEKKTEIPRDPVSLMEGAFLLGIGILEMSKEKSQDLANDLIERGKMSQSDAKKVADKIGEIAGEQQETLRKTVGLGDQQSAQDERPCDQGRGCGPQVADRGAQGDACRFRGQG